jgi:hypothetical protein
MATSLVEEIDTVVKSEHALAAADKLDRLTLSRACANCPNGKQNPAVK